MEYTITIFTFEKIIYVLVVFCVYFWVAFNKHRKILDRQTELIDQLEKQIDYLKKIEKMRENIDEVWIEEFKKYNKDIDTINNRILKIEKKLN